MCKKNGFTLIELLVVISIIAVLMAIMMPALRKAKSQASQVVCQSNLRQLCMSLAGYTGDSNGQMPQGWNDSVASGSRWLDVLRPYYGESSTIILCPIAKKETAITDTSNIIFRIFPTQSDLYNYKGVFKSSYGFNEWVYKVTSGSRKNKSWQSMYTVNSAKDVPVFFDCAAASGWPEPYNEPPQFIGDSGFNTVEQMKRFCIPRHGDYVNGTFIDLSVRKVGLKQLWKVKWHRTYNTNSPEPRWPDWMASVKDY